MGGRRARIVAWVTSRMVNNSTYCYGFKHISKIKQNENILSNIWLVEPKMAINDRDFCWWKQHSTGSECIYFEKGSWWHGKWTSPKQCKPMRSGSIFIEVEKTSRQKSLEDNYANGVLTKVSPHRTLNSRKYVIKCEELDNIKVEEIKNPTRRNYWHQKDLCVL